MRMAETSHSNIQRARKHRHYFTCEWVLKEPDEIFARDVLTVALRGERERGSMGGEIS